MTRPLWERDDNGERVIFAAAEDVDLVGGQSKLSKGEVAKVLSELGFPTEIIEYLIGLIPTKEVPKEPDILITPGEEPEPCKCQIPEGMRWNNSPVTYWVDPDAKYSDWAIRFADDSFKEWMKVSSLIAEPVLEESKANIRIYVDEIDGPRGTLGVTYQPSRGFDMDVDFFEPPFSGDLIMDVAEGWSVKAFKDVLLHEIGHAIGIGHIADRNQVMNPSYVGQSKLGDWDASEADKRYPRGE